MAVFQVRHQETLFPRIVSPKTKGVRPYRAVIMLLGGGGGRKGYKRTPQPYPFPSHHPFLNHATHPSMPFISYLYLYWLIHYSSCVHIFALKYILCTGVTQQTGLFHLYMVRLVIPSSIHVLLLLPTFIASLVFSSLIK